MQYDLQLRPALTAIAAVIALSTTPAFAQDATATAQQPPVAVTPQTPVDTAPADFVVEPAPVLSQAEPQAASIAAPVPTMEPIVHQATVDDLRETQVERNVLPTRRTPSPVIADRARAVAPVLTTSTRTNPNTAPASQAPASGMARPVHKDTTVAATTGSQDNTLPYVGVGAATLLLLGGAAALSRRRRREDELPAARLEGEHVLDLTPDQRVARPVAAPIMARSASAIALPNGFDLSRFGRHTQAAYRGPTSDNPSLSLRKRLKRASFFDGRERIAAGIEGSPLPIATAARAAEATRADDEQIVMRPQTTRKRPSFRPAFTR